MDKENIKSVTTNITSIKRKVQNSKIDRKACLDMLRAGKTYAQIAEIYKCSTSAVYNVAKKFLYDINASITRLEEYKQDRADILTQYQLKILNAMDDEKLKKANVRDLTSSFKMFYDSERLERGKTTSNQGVVVNYIKKTRDNPLEV